MTLGSQVNSSLKAPPKPPPQCQVKESSMYLSLRVPSKMADLWLFQVYLLGLHNSPLCGLVLLV